MFIRSFSFLSDSNFKNIAVSIFLSLLLYTSSAYAQKVVNLNINDRNYVRVWDGIIIEDTTYVALGKISSIKKVGDTTTLSELGMEHYGKPVMILNSILEDDDIRRYVYHVAEVPDIYLEMHLPIIINGTLGSNLEKIHKDDIMSMKYVKSNNKQRSKIPLGAIELKVKH